MMSKKDSERGAVATDLVSEKTDDWATTTSLPPPPAPNAGTQEKYVDQQTIPPPAAVASPPPDPNTGTQEEPVLLHRQQTIPPPAALPAGTPSSPKKKADDDVKNGSVSVIVFNDNVPSVLGLKTSENDEEIDGDETHSRSVMSVSSDEEEEEEEEEEEDGSLQEGAVGSVQGTTSLLIVISSLLTGMV